MQRLGQHFAFQSAQRLAQGRIEEECKQSNGRKWFMKIDKMDQSKTILPTIWSQVRAPILKLGERVVTGIIGSMWDGPTHTDVLVRTQLEDMSHGAEAQCSCALMNLHHVARQEGHLPAEWVISADNTYKETKNTIFLGFIIFLLCVMGGCTPLKSVLVVFLIVGHTHDKLDRFFSRLGVSLKGHDYFTFDEMFAIIIKCLTTYDVQVTHMTDCWAWKELKPMMPAMKGIYFVHSINIYWRGGGIWMRWKQYMTDEAALKFKSKQSSALSSYGI